MSYLKRTASFLLSKNCEVKNENNKIRIIFTYHRPFLKLYGNAGLLFTITGGEVMDTRYRGYRSYEEQVEVMRVERLRKQVERDRKRRKLERILDPIAYLIGVIAIIAISALDSQSWIPTITFVFSVVNLATYGVWRGVLK